MRIVISLTAAAVVLGACVVVRSWQPCGVTVARHPDSPLASKIELRQRSFDLGQVPAGENRVVEVAVSNTGNHRLIVRNQDGMCCGNQEATAALVVPPQSQALLVVPIQVGDQPGTLLQSTSFVTNDPTLPSFTITVSAEVVDSGLD